MAIEGPLRELGIHDVFQLLDLSRKTGTLRVRSPERGNEGSVYFDAGTIVAATMKSNPHLLGTLLERSGKVTAADLARATALQRAGDKRRVGEILVAHGIVTPRDIDRYMRQQIQTVVFDLMSWSEGFFSFIEEPARPIRKDIAVRVTTESLLMEGARRIDEWSRMADRIPDARVLPRLAPLHDGPESLIDLLPREWEVLTVIDGEKSLHDIAEALAFAEFDVAKIVYGMLSTGLIEIAPGDGTLANA
ncbi:MAG TPA: DUF4388 domain-containing protein [Gemmatimonadaceae bacterium]|nr:DUF4388 domain-containing protein [Gemmatimonadaceae bacterium]